MRDKDLILWSFQGWLWSGMVCLLIWYLLLEVHEQSSNIPQSMECLSTSSLDTYGRQRDMQTLLQRQKISAYNQIFWSLNIEQNIAPNLGLYDTIVSLVRHRLCRQGLHRLNDIPTLAAGLISTSYQPIRANALVNPYQISY